MDTATQIVKDLQAIGFAVPDAHTAVVAEVLAKTAPETSVAPVAVTTPVVAAGSPAPGASTGTKRGPKKGTVSAFAYFRDNIALPEWYKIKEADKKADYKAWQTEHLSGRWAQIKNDKQELEHYQALAKAETLKNQQALGTA